jgi:hypothetical protein
MFLVKDRRLGMDNYVFVATDPRKDGFAGDVTEGATLDYDMNRIHIWPYGEASPQPQLGLDPANPKHFKVFKFSQELSDSGFQFVNFNTPFVVHSWSEYRKRYYPVPEEFAKTMTQDEWFDYLDEADSAAKLRRKQNGGIEPKAGSSPDQIAEWVARRHMSADIGIREVWYLRTGSPPDEIRLLEVSELYNGESATIEPIDFGLDVDGAKFKLFVADVTTDQLQKVKADPTRLPKNWMFDEAKCWGRRA